MSWNDSERGNISIYHVDRKSFDLFANREKQPAAINFPRVFRRISTVGRKYFLNLFEVHSLEFPWGQISIIDFFSVQNSLIIHSHVLERLN